jgi:hypothetical protein
MKAAHLCRDTDLQVFAVPLHTCAPLVGAASRSVDLRQTSTVASTSGRDQGLNMGLKMYNTTKSARLRLSSAQWKLTAQERLALRVPPPLHPACPLGLQPEAYARFNFQRYLVAFVACIAGCLKQGVQELYHRTPIDQLFFGWTRHRRNRVMLHMSARLPSGIGSENNGERRLHGRDTAPFSTRPLTLERPEVGREVGEGMKGVPRGTKRGRASLHCSFDLAIDPRLYASERALDIKHPPASTTSLNHTAGLYHA